MHFWGPHSVRVVHVSLNSTEELGLLQKVGHSRTEGRSWLGLPTHSIGLLEGPALHDDTALHRIAQGVLGGDPHPEEEKEPTLLDLGLLALAHYMLCQCGIAVQAAEKATQGAARVGDRLSLEVLARDALAEGHGLRELAVKLIQDLHLKRATDSGHTRARRAQCSGSGPQDGGAHLVLGATTRRWLLGCSQRSEQSRGAPST